MNNLLVALEVLAGVVFFIYAVIAWGAMSPRTRHCFRLVYGIIGLAGAALALDPFFGGETAPYARAALMFGFALYLVLDRRRIRPQREFVKDSEPTVPGPDFGAHA